MTAFVLVDSAHLFYCAVFGVVSTIPFLSSFKGNLYLVCINIIICQKTTCRFDFYEGKGETLHDVRRTWQGFRRVILPKYTCIHLEGSSGTYSYLLLQL